MNGLIRGIIIGILLASGATVAAGEFGWTDTSLLQRVAVAIEAIQTDIHAIRTTQSLR